MKFHLILPLILLLAACADERGQASAADPGKSEYIPEHGKNLNETPPASADDTVSCEGTALSFLKLSEPSIQATFFRQLDSIQAAQDPHHDLDSNTYIDLNPKLLNSFIADLRKAPFAETHVFEKEYNFKTAPPPFTDSKQCKDKISLRFDPKRCQFRMVIFNAFSAGGCQESTVVYTFQIRGNNLIYLGRNVAG